MVYDLIMFAISRLESFKAYLIEKKKFCVGSGIILTVIGVVCICYFKHDIHEIKYREFEVPFLNQKMSFGERRDKIYTLLTKESEGKIAYGDNRLSVDKICLVQHIKTHICTTYYFNKNNQLIRISIYVTKDSSKTNFESLSNSAIITINYMYGFPNDHVGNDICIWEIKDEIVVLSNKGNGKFFEINFYEPNYYYEEEEPKIKRGTD